MLIAAILEANVQLAFDFAVHLLGNQDATWIGDPLQPDSNVDPVAVEFTVLPNDNVTKVDPDAQTEGTSARGEMILYLNRASHRGQGTCELDERAITRCLNKSPFVAAEAGLDQFSLEPLELGVSGFLGALHERGITNHVSGQDRRQSPLNPVLRQQRPPNDQAKHVAGTRRRLALCCGPVSGNRGSHICSTRIAGPSSDFTQHRRRSGRGPARVKTPLML
jgi:hypothetical protein